MKITLRGRKISRGIAEGTALVSTRPISFFGGVDPKTGLVIERGHELEGKAIAGKILVFPKGKGSTVGSWVIYQLSENNVAPNGIINVEAEPIVAVGAILSKIPLVDKLDKNPVEVIKTGNYVKMDANMGVVEVHEAGESK